MVVLVSAVKELLLRVQFATGKLWYAFSFLCKSVVFLELMHLCKDFTGTDTSVTRTLSARKCLWDSRVCLCMLKKAGCVQRHGLTSPAVPSMFSLTKWDTEYVKVLFQPMNDSGLPAVCLLNVC